MITLKCSGCEKDFELQRKEHGSKVRKGRTRFFCNRDCYRSFSQKSTNPQKQKRTRKYECPCGSPKSENRNACPKCFSSYICRRYNARKLAAIEFMGGKCHFCNETKHPSSFQFHHTDPQTKDFTWDKLRMKAVDQVYNELKKTVLVCANCHSEHHSGGNNWIELDIEKKRFLSGLEEAKRCDSAGDEFTKPKPELTLKPRQVVPCESCGVLVERIEVKSRVFCSPTCSQNGHLRIEWPEDDVLGQMIRSQSTLSLSKKLGVSDKAIKKRCASRGIDTKRVHNVNGEHGLLLISQSGFKSRWAHEKRSNQLDSESTNKSAAPENAVVPSSSSG